MGPVSWDENRNVWLCVSLSASLPPFLKTPRKEKKKKSTKTKLENGNYFVTKPTCYSTILFKFTGYSVLSSHFSTSNIIILSVRDSMFFFPFKCSVTCIEQWELGKQRFTFRKIIQFLSWVFCNSARGLSKSLKNSQVLCLYNETKGILYFWILKKNEEQNIITREKH